MRVFNILITNIPNNVNLKKIPIGFNYDLTSIKDPEIRVEFFKAVYDMADYAHTNYYDRKMRNKNPEDIESISICQTNHEIAEKCHIKAIYDPLDKNGHEEISIDEEFNIIGTQTNIGDYLEGLQLEEYRKLIYAQYQRVYKDGRCNARNCVCKDSGEMIKLDDKHCFSKIMKLYSFTLCCGAIHRDCFLTLLKFVKNVLIVICVQVYAKIPITWVLIDFTTQLWLIKGLSVLKKNLKKFITKLISKKSLDGNLSFLLTGLRVNLEKLNVITIGIKKKKKKKKKKKNIRISNHSRYHPLLEDLV
jgi:hypothetical protein